MTVLVGVSANSRLPAERSQALPSGEITAEEATVSALWNAVRNGHLSIVELLVKHGAMIGKELAEPAQQILKAKVADNDTRYEHVLTPGPCTTGTMYAKTFHCTRQYMLQVSG